jgi:hypothetical protein
MGMRWNEIESLAPAIADAAQKRFEATRVALLGTIRSDGSPRISPVEPYFSQGHLLFGAMSWSLKTRDLLADPRCVLHTAITAPDAGEPEVKLHGRAIEAPRHVRDGCSVGWWHTRPAASAAVFSLDIERATWIEWNLDQGQMIVRRWSVGDGLSESTRSYP